MIAPSDCFLKQTLYSVILRDSGILLNGINSVALSCKKYTEEMIEDMKEIVNDQLPVDNCKDVK